MSTLESIENSLNFSIKKVTEKSKEVTKQLYYKSKDEIGKINEKLQYKNIKVSDLGTTIKALIAHKNFQEIKQIVQLYGSLILAMPGVRDLLATGFLQSIGFTALGVKTKSLAALYQSNYLGGYIAKDSIFAYLQSTGATSLFDPTMISLILIGGAAAYYYYFYVYRKADPKANAFSWKFKDSFQQNQFTVPKNVSYQDRKFNIKWSNLHSDIDKHRKYFI